jgi:hypothetical protein
MSCRESWKDYRRRFRVTAALWMAPPAVIYVTQVAGVTQIWLIVAWLTAFAAAMTHLYSFRCPRCGQWFFIKGATNRPLARACVNCGLPKWAIEDHAPPAPPEGGEA